MISIDRFAPEHLEEMQIQEAQLQEMFGQPAMMALRLADSGPCFTARGLDGRILQCSGFIENHPRYASAWAFLAADWPCAKVGLHRATRRVIAATSYVRIDMSVRTGFVAAHDWALMLGFVREGTLRRSGYDGSDFDVYALIREDR